MRRSHVYQQLVWRVEGPPVYGQSGHVAAGARRVGGQMKLGALEPAVAVGWCRCHRHSARRCLMQRGRLLLLLLPLLLLLLLLLRRRHGRTPRQVARHEERWLVELVRAPNPLKHCDRAAEPNEPVAVRVVRPECERELLAHHHRRRDRRPENRARGGENATRDLEEEGTLGQQLDAAAAMN